MRITHKIWLEKDGQVVFGEGREEILTAVAECGSLYSAARRLKMSYRSAWGKIKRTEERLGLKLVETHDGGRGLRLTAEGKRLLDEFHRLEDDVRSFIKNRTYDFALIEKPSENKK
jgi:molybdate transport system regulatory protein